MHCSLSASPEATSRHGIGESIGAYGTSSKKTWFRQAPLRKRTNRFRKVEKGRSKWTPPRVKKCELPVKRNILASKAFCLLEGELLHSPSQNGSWGQKNGSFLSRSPNEKILLELANEFFLPKRAIRTLFRKSPRSKSDLVSAIQKTCTC